ncbi:actin-like protein ARP9 [Naviculisporaceae sp. PSN 640]
MSTQGKWREEQILVICPGSHTTMAQLGCGELTPPANRYPTRMFKDEESENWRPYYTFKRRKEKSTTTTTNGEGAKGTAEEDEWEWVEDQDSAEGAVYPLQGGRIVHMDAFLAFLDHVHSMLTTTNHNTPIVLMASPQWTRPDCEMITRYIFEKTKTPALCMIHSGVATQYGLKWPNMTVVDIGFEKVDVTCIHDSRIVSHRDVGPVDEEGKPREISGGEVFTRKLMKLLEGKGFDYDMAEQLKKSPVCEVLPYVPESDKLMELPAETPASGVGGGAGAGAAPAAAPVGAPKIVEPVSTTVPVVDDDGPNPDDAVDEEGVLNIATIVTSGQTREFLAKKEKEKQEKGKPGRKPKDKEAVDPAAARARLPNSKRTWNVFHYEDLVTEEVPIAPPAPPAKDVEMTDAAAAPNGENSAANGTAAEGTNGAPKPEPAAETKPPAEGEAPKPEETPAPTAAVPADSAANPEAAPPATVQQVKRVRRDIEVGLERFQFADRAEIDRIASAIYDAVQGIEDMYMRPGCWENLVFVGNGARIRGLKDNIMQTLQARHLISPSSATMFTSELPSNIGTPSGTGSQTPTGSFTGALPTTSSVNPLLQAATTASLGVPGGAGAPGAPNSNAGDVAGTNTHFHSQTPTQIKQAALPTYLSEWTKNGFEEAMFLGAQVAARLAFCIHNLDGPGTEAQRFMSFSRVDYNELGPKGIRSHSLLA